ncbi:sugar ABC transporter ATP-binding protein [Paractinoplanes atraurantiacus]|uniref:Simple sugar transport system ATP-binding protein n=1 Tax=Paractinoplanes atraurantiacus TaxID=1036182 RepID=A0A285GP41_9ACTN|nr:sugar ABC transporter ATP-binding protein [Actinoplanes atraurantiacus]SNY25073.1 simple sugar transport system ATP-binding protein [Actinoplanes atraurantiacus]
MSDNRDAAPPVVEATKISKRFGSTVALRDAGLVVRPGQTHALVGRNGAGKSTLVSILTGLQQPDAGRLRFGGRPAPRINDRDGWRREVACVYQKSTIIGSLSVAENLFLNRQDRGRAGLLDWPGVRRRARELLATYGVDVDVRTLAGDLSVERRQFVEIARALSFGARFIILDEPTAQLDAAAIARLFSKIRELQAQRVTFLFISHHLQEVYDICDTVTVFRDARWIVTAPVAELPRADLVAAMTGDAGGLTAARERPAVDAAATPTLQVRDLIGDNFAELSLDIRPGEIVGVAGAGGSGRTELAETIVGLRRPASGTTTVGGAPVKPGDVGAGLAAGIGFVPQDRHRQGFVADMSIADNATMTIAGRLGRAGLISRRRTGAEARAMIESLAIKTTGPELAVRALSGGNQQKVVMARALASHPRLLVLINPTAGVDVRSKEFLLSKVDEAADRGTAVLVASDELDDLRPCDRVLVLFQGRLVAELPRGWHDHELVAAMEGLNRHV